MLEQVADPALPLDERVCGNAQLGLVFQRLRQELQIEHVLCFALSDMAQFSSKEIHRILGFRRVGTVDSIVRRTRVRFARIAKELRLEFRAERLTWMRSCRPRRAA